MLVIPCRKGAFHHWENHRLGVRFKGFYLREWMGFSGVEHALPVKGIWQAAVHPTGG